MAIIHNLSDPADNLSCFDPVADYTNGTTIGRSWILWKIFEGFSTFFPNFKKITNSSPTPTFLQGDVGANLQTEPTLDRVSTSDYLRFYDTNDPGLNLSPPRAIIYQWRVSNTIATRGLIDMKTLYHKDGEALYNPFLDHSLCTNDSELNSNLYTLPFYYTTTNMMDIPKIIFWKSSNAYAMMSVNKSDGLTRGYGLFFLTNLNYQGYKHNIGAITHNAIDLHLNVLLSGYGMQFMEGSEEHQGSDALNMLGGNVSYITHLSSMGRTPTVLLEFDSKQNVIGGNYRIGYVNLTKTKVVSDPIEGLLLCSPTAVSGSIGSIETYNNKYYLLMGNISDGANSHRVLLELGPVTP